LTEPRKKYRTTWPKAEDTTDGQIPLVTPGFLRLVGELLYGAQWLSPLAHNLGKVRGKSLAPATVHRWTHESRSIPAWVADALAEVLQSAQRDFSTRARQAGEIAGRLRCPPSADRAA
jgi:hypothetical protein